MLPYRARHWTFAVAFALSAPAWANDLDAAEALLQAGRPAEAQAQLQRGGAQIHGARYQALLGRAVLDQGDAEAAVDHLHTALKLNPGDDAARLDLARAYVAVGDALAARVQIDYLLAHTRAPHVAAAAQRLATALNRRTRPSPFAVDTERNETPGFGREAAASSRLFASLAPDPDARLARTPLTPGFSARTQQPLFGDSFVFGDISNFKSQRYQGQDTAKLTDVVAGTGFQWGQDEISVPLSHREFLDDQQHYGRFDAMGLEWSRRVDADNRFTVAAQRGGYTRDDQTTADVASVQGLMAWTRQLGEQNAAQVTGSVFLGDDTAKNEAYRSLGRRFYGVSVEGRVNLFTHHTPYTSVQLKHSDYNGDQALALAPRREDYARIAAGWEWQIMPNWGLRAEANYSLNNSTVDTYQYDRSQLFLTTRFDFR